MTYYASKHGKGLANTLDAIRNRKEFKSGGALWAKRVDPPYVVAFAGQLPDEERQRLNAEPPTYIVFSYNTPIGWYVPDGGWYIPEVKYSQTTTGHQSVLTRAVQDLY